MGRHVTAFVTYLSLTTALTWPLVLHLDSAVASDLGDPLLSIWTLWWNSTTTPLTERWWNGSMFFPAGNTLALSDHRLGIAPISTPLIWAGASPVTAYNVAFMASFTLSATAAYALGFVLTRRFDASLLAGLVFGFNPFRAGHLPHLELLCSFWLPIILLTLHRWYDTRRHAWLALLTLSLTMQALTSSYYFTFVAVLIGLWMAWFGRGLPVRQLAALGASAALSLLIVSPIIVRYRDAHEVMGLARTLTDVEHFSADLIGVITTAQTRTLWKTPLAWDRAEGALYPGIVAVAIVLAAVVVFVATTDRDTTRRLSRVRRSLLGSAAIFVAAAAVARLAPFSFDVGGVTISANSPYKPLSIALISGTLWLLSAAPVRAAWQQRSALMFYALATVAMFAFALGPTGRVAGERFLYKGPYAWLMVLPGVDTSFRVPARFGMLAALTLCAAVALAWARLTRGRSTHAIGAATLVLAVAVVADSWIDPLALPAAPPSFAIPAGAPSDAAVVELPLGTYEDAAAMYRAIAHQRPTLNGLSGFAPAHYEVLHASLAEGRTEALLAIAEHAPLLVFVDRAAAGQHLLARVAALPFVTRLTTTTTHDILLVPRQAAASANSADTSARVAVTAAHTLTGEDVTEILSDGNRTTGWITPTQQGVEGLVVDLGTVRQVTGVALSQGTWPGGFPRELAIRSSQDGVHWQDGWRGEISAIAVRAAVRDPRNTTMMLAVGPRPARYLELRQHGWSSLPWAVAELQALVTD
jgi:hypothetical protein